MHADWLINVCICLVGPAHMTCLSTYLVLEGEGLLDLIYDLLTMWAGGGGAVNKKGGNLHPCCLPWMW